jgi:hypothetical protein
MIFLTIFLVLLLSLILWLLFTTISIEIDSKANIYKISFGAFISTSFEETDGKYVIHIHLFFGYDFFINPLSFKSRKKKLDKKKAQKKINPFKITSLIRKVIASFELKLFEAEFDTGDYTMNALLIPVFLQLNYLKHPVNVNFEDRNSIHIILENRAFNFLRIFIFSR